MINRWSQSPQIQLPRCQRGGSESLVRRWESVTTDSTSHIGKECFCMFLLFSWKGLRFSTLQTFGSNNLSMMSMWSSHGISSSLSLTFCGKLPSNCPSNVSRLGPEDLELFGRNFDWKWCFLHNFMSNRWESYFWDWRRHWFLVIKRNVSEENQAYHK